MPHWRVTYTEVHQEANAALVRLSAEVFAHHPAELDDLYSRILSAMLAQQPRTRPLHVALMTVLRLKQEAHAVRMLLGLGYPTQALALAAGMMEFAYDLLYIRDDDTRAGAWEAFEPLTYSLWRGTTIKQRMRDSLDALGLTGQELDDAVNDDYGLYGILCAAKHGHPSIQKMTGGTVEGDTLIAGPHDYRHDDERRNAVFAMHAVFRASNLGILAVLEYHLTDPARTALSGPVAAFHKTAQNAVTALTDH